MAGSGTVTVPSSGAGQLEFPWAPTRFTAVCSVHPGDPVPQSVRVAGRVLDPTPVFTAYWRFAAERHAIYLARVAGRPGPWTDDPVLLRHRFTNCFRVSQYLIREVSYTGSQRAEEIIFRTLLFRFFNRISTWELLSAAMGELTWAGFDLASYDGVLHEAFAAGHRLYSAALSPHPHWVVSASTPTTCGCSSR